MPAPKVLIHSDHPEIALEVLKQTHADVTPSICTSYHGLGECVEKNRPEVVYSLRSSSEPFPREALVESDSIAWVSNAGSGVNHLSPWDSTRVTVTNSAGVAADMMAEYTLGILLYFSLDIPGMLDDQKQMRWSSRYVSPVHGKTLLIIGLGKTGQAISKKASALGLHITGIRARPKPTKYVDKVYSTNELHQALSQADFIVICLPLLENTFGMLGETEFKKMKPGSILVDISRGGIVNQKSLIKALETGILKAAGLDVFEKEPLPADNPLWQFKNVLISPHCSSVYKDWETKSAHMFAENLTRWRENEPLKNIVDPDRGY